MRFSRQNPRRSSVSPSQFFVTCSLIFFGSQVFNLQVSAHEYTFCAKNVLYTFSSEACPGGILLKKSVQIDEPCHCFEADLKIYSSCSNDKYQEGPSSPSGCSSPLFQKGGAWNGQAMMMIPGDLPKINRTGRDSCFGMPKTCGATPETIVTKTPTKIVEFMKTLAAAQKLEIGANKTSGENSTEDGDSAEDESEESGSGENSNKTVESVTKRPVNISENSTRTTEKPRDASISVASFPSEKRMGEGGLEIGPVINIASQDLNLDNKIDAVEIKAEISELNKTTIDPIQENLRKESFNDVLMSDEETLRLARDGATNEESTTSSPPSGHDSEGDVESTTVSPLTGTEGGGDGEEDDDNDSGADSEEGEDEELETHNGDGSELTPDPLDPTDVVALLRHIQGVKEGRIADPEPNTKTFQLIKQSMRIVQQLTPNHVIKNEHFYEAYLAFRYLFGALDEDLNTDRHFTTNYEDFSAILLALQDCESSVPTLIFKTSGPLHKIEALRIPHQHGVTEEALEIPADRSHKPDNEDYVVGIMWKIIDIVHSACYSEFKWNSPQTQFDYFVAIEDLFMQPTIQKRWNEPQLLSKESEGKLELISHPDIKLLMENLDAVDAAAHSTFGFEFFLKKPKSSGSVAKAPSPAKGQSSDKSRRRKRKSRKIHKEHLSRKKREEPSSKSADSDWAAFEIWGGQAYCLQKRDPVLPSTVQNSLPNPQELCKNTQ